MNFLIDSKKVVVEDVIGDLKTLSTSDKRSIINAINELKSTINQLTGISEGESLIDLTPLFNELANHKDSVSSVTSSGHVKLNDTLISVSTSEALTAAKGKVLDEKIKTVSNTILTHSHQANLIAGLQEEINKNDTIINLESDKHTHDNKSALNKIVESNTSNEIYDLSTIVDGAPKVKTSNHDIDEYTVEGETTTILRTKRNDSDVYTIFEIAAPDLQPKEATLALMLPPNETRGVCFVDNSLMSYGDKPVYITVLQTRGSKELYPYVIGTNHGKGIKELFRFNPDGTFELVKEDATSNNRKLKLGGYGYLQDRLHDHKAELAENHMCCVLNNCYITDETTNTYKCISVWTPAIKIELGNGKIRCCICPMKVLKASPNKTFTEDSWVEIAVMDLDGLAAKYKASDGSIGINGTFTSIDGKIITVKDGIITSIL